MLISLLNKISNRLLLHNAEKLPHYTGDDFSLVLKPLDNDKILHDLDIVAGFYNDSDEPIKISVFKEDSNVFHPYTETVILPKKFVYALDDKFMIPIVYTPYQLFRVESTGASPLVVGVMVDKKYHSSICQPHFGFSKDLKEYFNFDRLFDLTRVKPLNGIQVPDMRGVPLVVEGVASVSHIEEIIGNSKNSSLSVQSFPKLVDLLEGFTNGGLSDSFLIGNANNRNDIYSAKGSHTMIVALSDVEGGDMVFEEGYDIKLKRGDAVIFDNRTRFLCTPVERGNKLILSCQINV